MSLVLVAWKRHERYPLIVAANREDFHDRATDPARWRDDAPDLLAGCDIDTGGAWLGAARRGRFAVVTGYRDPRGFRTGMRYQGELVVEYLLEDVPARAYLRTAGERRRDFNPFSLIAFDGEHLGWCSSRLIGAHGLKAGVYGLSNHLLDTPWPKVRSGKAALEALLAGLEIEPRDLLELLEDRTAAPDAALPTTGLGAERERWLSPRFVIGDGYGTRSSTVLRVAADGRATFVERSFDRMGVETATVRHDFEMLVSGSLTAR